MSIGLYDKEIVKKISYWVKDKHTPVLKPDEVTRLFQQKIDISKDKPLDLPLIMISREPEIEISNVSKRPLSYDGALINSDGVSNEQLQGIPITIHYQIDIFTKKFDECEEYVREFVYKMINSPTLKIEVPYNDSKIIQNSSIRIVPSIQDNSDLKNKLFPDQFTRMTLKFDLDDAYLFSVSFKDNLSIESTIETNNKGE